MSKESDRQHAREIEKLFQRGDVASAIGRSVDVYGPRIREILEKRLKDPDLAADAYQHLWEHVAKKARLNKTGHYPSSIEMLSSLARDISLDLSRRRRNSGGGRDPAQQIAQPHTVAESAELEAKVIETARLVRTQQHPVEHDDLLLTLRRVVELMQLRPGWHDGGGTPVQEETALRVARTLRTLLKHGLPRPVLFPMEDGGVQVVWRAPPWRIEVEFEPSKPRASAIAVNVDTKEDDDVSVNLSAKAGGQRLLAFLAKFLTPDAEEHS